MWERVLEGFGIAGVLAVSVIATSLLAMCISDWRARRWLERQRRSEHVPALSPSQRRRLDEDVNERGIDARILHAFRERLDKIDRALDWEKPKVGGYMSVSEAYQQLRYQVNQLREEVRGYAGDHNAELEHQSLRARIGKLEAREQTAFGAGEAHNRIAALVERVERVEREVTKGVLGAMPRSSKNFWGGVEYARGSDMADALAYTFKPGIDNVGWIAPKGGPYEQIKRSDTDPWADFRKRMDEQHADIKRRLAELDDVGKKLAEQCKAAMAGVDLKFGEKIDMGSFVGGSKHVRTAVLIVQGVADGDEYFTHRVNAALREYLDTPAAKEGKTAAWLASNGLGITFGAADEAALPDGRCRYVPPSYPDPTSDKVATDCHGEPSQTVVGALLRKCAMLGDHRATLEEVMYLPSKPPEGATVHADGSWSLATYADPKPVDMTPPPGAQVNPDGSWWLVEPKPVINPCQCELCAHYRKINGLE